MAKSINTNFTVLAPKPIDTRMQVATYNLLDAIPVKYNHMITHVEDENAEYKYYENTNTWELHGVSNSWGAIIGDITSQADLMAYFSNYALASHTHAQEPPLLHQHSELDITDLDKYTKQEVDDLLISNTGLSTGVLTQGLISINSDNTKFDLSKGIGIKTVWTSSDPFINPISYKVNYGDETGITPTYLATYPRTYIGIFYNETLDVVITVQNSTPFSPTARRSIIYVGYVEHVNNISINKVVNEVFPSVNIGNQLHDLYKMVGGLNLHGNTYTFNGANLSINKSEGEYSFLGSNYSNPNSPSIKLSSLEIQVSFNYKLQTGVEYSTVTSINPNSYDNAGVLTVVPGNKWTVQRIYLELDGSTKIQYGQTVYESYGEALGVLESSSFVTEQNLLVNSIFRGFLVIKQGATILNNSDYAVFINVTKFGWAEKPVKNNIISSTSQLINDGNGISPFATLDDLLITSENRVISGGMFWDSGLTYKSNNLIYELNGVIYNIPDNTEVTLDPAPTTGVNNRFDIIYANDAGLIGIAKGIEGDPALTPILEINQLQIHVVILETNTTEAFGVSAKIVFQEDLAQPSEFDILSMSPSLSVVVSTPINGLNSIRTNPRLAHLDNIVFFSNTYTELYSLIKLTFNIKLLEPWIDDTLVIGLFLDDVLGATLVLNTTYLDFTDTTNVQEVVLFKDNFHFVNSSITQINTIKFIGSISNASTLSFILDDIILYEDVSLPLVPSIDIYALNVFLDTTNFNNNLDNTITDVQKLADAFDNYFPYGTRIENAAVTGTYALNHNLANHWKLTLTGNTTFSDLNLPTGTKTKEFTIKMTGAFVPSFPAYWGTLQNQAYDGTKWNYITVQIENGTTSSEEFTVFNSVLEP